MLVRLLPKGSSCGIRARAYLRLVFGPAIAVRLMRAWSGATPVSPQCHAMTDTPALRKARGAFFTPPEMSRLIASWAIRSADDSVLEPSCGEASFLLSAAERLAALGAARMVAADRLHGVELHSASAAEAHRLVRRAGWESTIQVADFFDVEPTRKFDAVIGNPPYIRYQQFAGEARAKGLQAALKQGVRLNGLSSAWAPFVVHAADFLKPGGRLGLVLPAELLAVKYAAEVRRFLLNRFSSVRLVMFEQLVFPGVMEEVVLLLAEGSGSVPSFEVFQARDLSELEQFDRATWTWFVPDDTGKWTPALLPSHALGTYGALTASESFDTLSDWGDTYLGAVTGNNRYFALTLERSYDLKLRDSDLVRVSPPGSKHLRGLTFSNRAWASLADAGQPCYLFAPDPEKPSAAARRYIAMGEAMGVQHGYKCRNRRPWWRVPRVAKPDLLMTYMDHDRPRLTTNGARADILNSLYGVKLRDDRRALGVDVLPIACLNSVTLLGGEMVGRAYGGGMLKLEPTEADRLPVPSAQALQPIAGELRALKPRVTGALRTGALAEAVNLVDQLLLAGQLGLSPDEIQSLRDAREVLFARRSARGKGIRSAD